MRNFSLLLLGLLEVFWGGGILMDVVIMCVICLRWVLDYWLAGREGWEGVCGGGVV